MDFHEWEPIYELIIKDFGYSREKDEEAARLLHSILGKRAAEDNILESRINGKRVIICGASERLENEFVKILSENRDAVMAADEATSIVIKHTLPDIIVTDLDGNVEEQIKANEMGSIAVIHAHGDNIRAIKKYAPLFTGKVILTTQSEPFDNVYNFGGFTDGDRAFFMAKHFGAESISLAGFDFENPREKEGKDIEIKRRKLRWAKRLIEM